MLFTLLFNNIINTFSLTFAPAVLPSVLLDASWPLHSSDWPIPSDGLVSSLLQSSHSNQLNYKRQVFFLYTQAASHTRISTVKSTLTLVLSASKAARAPLPSSSSVSSSSSSSSSSSFYMQKHNAKRHVYRRSIYTSVLESI